MSYENIADKGILNKSDLKNDSWVRKSLKRDTDLHSHTQ